MDRKTEFLKKLSALLTEYDCHIETHYEGDSHGIHNEHMAIWHKTSPISQERWWRNEYQLYITPQGINENMDTN